MNQATRYRMGSPMVKMEAEAGVEPASTALQAAA
tara:strand:- start:214 stop:315 length:102 start_codon:yes stop_codon:yes gene_type:complete